MEQDLIQQPKMSDIRAGIITRVEELAYELKIQEVMTREIQTLAPSGIPAEILREKSLLTPSCGMGLMSVEDAEKAMKLLAELSGRMREKYFPES